MILGFHKAATTYHSQAWVQAQIAQELAQQIFPYVQHQKIIVEFGAGTGLLSQYLCQFPALELWRVTDLSVEMLGVHQELWQSKSPVEILYECADVRSLQYPRTPLLLISNATVQWLPDLVEWLASLVDELSPGSQVAFSYFGPQNLFEFYDSYRLAFHVDFPVPITLWNPDELIQQCRAQGWMIQHTSNAKIIQREKDLWSLLRHFKSTGVYTAGDSVVLTKSRLMKWQEQYHQNFGDEQGISCSWDYGIICLQKK